MLEAVPAAVRSATGQLDVLVNNAAAFVDWTETASRANLDQARRVMDVNVFGPGRLTQVLLPHLLESPSPRIVNVSSGAGSHGDDQFGLTRRNGAAAATYGISKAALNALTATLAAELADTGILVNAVCPGLTATWPGAEQMGARPVTDGASVIAAVTLPPDGPSGAFLRDGHAIPW